MTSRMRSNNRSRGRLGLIAIYGGLEFSLFALRNRNILRTRLSEDNESGK